MTAAPDTHVLPLAPGTVCLLDGQQVRAYYRPPGLGAQDHRYEVVPVGQRRAVERPKYATHEQLEVSAC